jgi:phosphoadenosine phosphosulfate reductase
MNSLLQRKIEKSQQVLKETFQKWSPEEVAIAFTGGKDSTVVLHMVREYFNKKVPCPVLFVEESHFKEVYDFVKKLKESWELNLIVSADKKSLKEYYQTKDRERKKELARILKINALKKALKEYQWQALMVGIRWDEHPARAKETYFSLREDPCHTRVHPILHFKEKDIWEYIKIFNVPYNPLYKQGYRSLGEKEFTKPTPPQAEERAGRERSKEEIMEQLRQLGYF